MEESRESVRILLILGRLFLNCTKNTELTRPHFARTFTFALATKLSVPKETADLSQRKKTNPEQVRRAMKSEQWKTYRTRFLVKAKQLNSALSFTDHLGRQHCGRKGDYLVESCDGVLSIAPRQIFEDIYVSMAPANQPLAEAISDDTGLEYAGPRNLKHFRFEPLEIQKIPEVKFHRSSANTDRLRSDGPVRRRKSPQPVRQTSALNNCGKVPKFQSSTPPSFTNSNALVF